MKLLLIFGLAIATATVGIGGVQPTATHQDSENSTTQNRHEEQATSVDRAADRTRREIRMLDDIYKGGIVLITKHYVEGDEDLPAGTAFKKLFEAAKENGWHEVRLVDATGEPYNEENVAISEFEKRAIKQTHRRQAVRR